MISKMQFGLEGTREASAPRREKTQATDDEPGFAAALDQVQTQDEPKAVTSRDDDPSEDEAPVEPDVVAAPEDAGNVAQEMSESIGPTAVTLAQLVVPSDPPRPPETKAYNFETAPPAAKEPAISAAVPSSVEVDVDLSVFDPSSRPPASSLPPVQPGLDDLTAAELASGFEMPWKTTITPEKTPSTLPMPVNPASPEMESAVQTLAPTAAMLTGGAETPEGDTLVPGTEASDRQSSPAPQRASLHDAVRRAMRRSTQPSMHIAREAASNEPEASNTEALEATTETLEGAEVAEADDPLTRRSATPKAFAASEPSPARERTASTRVQASAASTQIADEQVQQRQEAATSAVNRMTLRHFAQADVDHPELGRIRVAARNVAGEVDVEMSARDANTVAVLQSTTGQLSSELRQASVELRDLDVRQDEEALADPSADRRGQEADERAPDRDRQARASHTEPSDDSSTAEPSTGSPVRIVL